VKSELPSSSLGVAVVVKLNPLHRGARRNETPAGRPNDAEASSGGIYKNRPVASRLRGGVKREVVLARNPGVPERSDRRRARVVERNVVGVV